MEIGLVVEPTALAAAIFPAAVGVIVMHLEAVRADTAGPALAQTAAAARPVWDLGEEAEGSVAVEVVAAVAVAVVGEEVNRE